MAERRMFSKSIIDSDSFIDMPVTARLLYYDLAMRADDDGFVNAPKKIMRMVGASQDDLSILSLRGFIIPFENGVVVITHWKKHNYIKNDRYKPTDYQNLKDRLEIKNNVYKLISESCIQNVSKMEPKCIQNGTKMEPQVRLGKDSIGKDSITPLYPPIFDNEKFKQVWGDYRQHRKEIKHKLTPKSEQMALNKLAKMAKTCDEAIAIVEQSIANGWQGLFELKKWKKHESKFVLDDDVDLLGNPFEDIIGSNTNEI